MKRKSISQLLIITLLAVSLPVPASAATVSEPADEKKEEYVLPKDYVEGEVLLTVMKNSEEEILGGVGDELLSEAEELADVSEVFVRENKASLEQDTGEELPLGAFDDEVVIKLVKSDEYTTAELIDMYKDLPFVISAEANEVFSPDDEAFAEVQEAPIEEEPAVLSGLSSEEDVKVQDKSALPEDEAGVPASEEAVNEEQIVKGTADPDYTGYQYFATAKPGGTDVPDWNNSSFTSSKDVVVAVLDTGVDYTHPDLTDVMWDKGLEYPELAQKGGGRCGYNAAEKRTTGEAYDSTDPMDDDGHGTHCAGIIAANWNDSGISGICTGIKLMAVKASDEKGSLAASSLIKGMDYITAAKASGVNVVAVNNSYGNYAGGNIYKYLVRKCVEKGINMVYSAGNNGINTDSQYHSSSYFRDIPGVLVVCANDSMGRKASFSNYGRMTTDLFAPGHLILSTYPTDEDHLQPSLFADDADAYLDFDERFDLQVPLTEGVLETVSDDIVTSWDGNDQNRAFRSSVPFSSALDRKKNDRLTLSADNVFDALPEPPEYISFKVMVTKPDTKVVLYIRYKDPKTDKNMLRGKTYTPRPGMWTNYSYELPEYTCFDEFKAYFYLYNTATDDASVYLDDISLTHKLQPYKFNNGTSMAAPGVTAAAAWAAIGFDDDTLCSGAALAEKRANRIRRSVKKDDALMDLCRTGGIVNVRNLLEENYEPLRDDPTLDRDNVMERIPLTFLKDLDKSQTVDMVSAADGYLYFRTFTYEKYYYYKYDVRKKQFLKTESLALPLADYNSYVYDKDRVIGTRKGKVNVFDKKTGKTSIVTISSDMINKDKSLGMSLQGNDLLFFSSYYTDDEKAAKAYDKTAVLKAVAKNGYLDLEKVGSLQGYFENPKVVSDDKGNMYVTDTLRAERIVYDAAADSVSSDVINDRMFEKKTIDEKYDYAAVKDGILIFGDLEEEDPLKVDHDVYLMSYDDGSVKSVSSCFARHGTYSNELMVYHNEAYFLACDFDDPYMYTMAHLPVETLSCNEDSLPETDPGNDPGKDPSDKPGSDPDDDKGKDKDKDDDEKGGDDVSGNNESGDSRDDIYDGPYETPSGNKVVVDGKILYVKATLSVNYTGQKHVMQDSKSKGSRDLFFELNGLDKTKYYVKKVTVKNALKASHGVSGDQVAKDKKRPCMVPGIKAVKGVKLSKEDKSYLKALNKYFKQNPAYFAINRIDLQNEKAGSIEPVLNSKGTKVTKLMYKPSGKGEAFMLKKPDYTIEDVVLKDDGTIASFKVAAKPGKNLQGQRVITVGG